MGDAKSLATHSAPTTHRRFTPAELPKAGVTPEAMRRGIGTEQTTTSRRI
jgi:O-acetylhomoserine/O-acetylserine sulfhydrylase-like pyridoxal-dependent enzyme